MRVRVIKKFTLVLGLVGGFLALGMLRAIEESIRFFRQDKKEKFQSDAYDRFKYGLFDGALPVRAETSEGDGVEGESCESDSSDSTEGCDGQ